MSVSQILNANGVISNQYLPANPDPHPYVENPMVENLDCGGFQLSNVGTYASTLSFTQTGGPVGSPPAPVAQPLAPGLYYMTVNLKLFGAGATPADFYYDVRNQAGSVQMVQNIITADQQTTLGYNCSVSHIFQVPASYSAYINYTGTLSGALDLGASGAVSIVLTKIF
jgi:hypothetical protein